MKKYIILTYTVVSLCKIAIAQTISNTCPPTTKTEAQQNEICEDGKGITTNPSNPANTECPILINNFDWKLKNPISGTIIEEEYDVYDGDNINRKIINPFNDNDNFNDYRYLALKQNSNYYPEDGWELLKVDFGALGNIGLGVNVNPGRNTDVTGPRLPYMILYNKYSGTFRFFGSLLGQMEGYETIRIELRIPETSPGADPSDQSTNLYESPLKATNLLSIQGDAVQPLDQETDENVLVVFAKASNNSNKFFWFDIPVAYDPCLCNIRSQLDITFAFVETANINLNGTIDGALKTETKDDGSGPTAVKVATTVIAAGVSTVLAVKTGGAVINFQAYADLVKLFKYIPGLSDEQQENLEKLGNYVDCGAKFAKVIHGNYSDVVGKDDKKAIKAGNNILDANTTFLSSLASGCDKKDNGATTINATANLSGSWTEKTNIGGTEIKLAMPGSKWDDRKRFIRSHTDTENDNKTIAAYPTYNERLGTFALLETPKTFVTHYSPDDLNNNRIFRIKPDHSLQLKYTLNPLMNVNSEKTKVFFRYVVKDTRGLKLATSVYHNAYQMDVTFYNRNIVKNEGSLYPVSSAFLPIEYYNDFSGMVFITDETNGIGTSVDSIFIQLKVVMVSNDIGSDGSNIESIYYYNYPIMANEHALRSTPPSPARASDLMRWAEANSKLIISSFLPKSEILIEGDKSFSQDILFPGNGVLFYDGLVEISAKMATATGRMIIYSTIGFELLPGAEIDPSIELIVGYPYESNPIPSQTYTEVSSFCTSNKYKAQEFSAAAVEGERVVYEERERARALQKMEEDKTFVFAVKPNPTKDKATVFWDGDENPSHISVIDAAGSVLFETTLAGDAVRFHLDMTPYSTGVYNIIIISSTGKRGYQKLIKL